MYGGRGGASSEAMLMTAPMPICCNCMRSLGTCMLPRHRPCLLFFGGMIQLGTETNC